MHEIVYWHNNTAVAENEYFRIEIDYVTSGTTYATLYSKTFTGDIDVAVGINSKDVNINSVHIYDPFENTYYIKHSRFFYYVSNVRLRDGEPLDIGNEYNEDHYIFDHLIPEPDGGLTPATSVIAIDGFYVTSETNNNYTVIYETEYKEIVDWKKMWGSVIDYDYDDKDRWYVTQNRSIEAGNEYLIRIDASTVYRVGDYSYKYDFAIKRSSDSLSDAISSGHLYLIDPYWNISWNYYKVITINKTMVNQAIGDVQFPLLVSITDTDLRDHAQADGDDIVFTDSANTTQLDHTIELWNSTTGELVVWVNVTDIVNVSSINMYYNNSGATNTENAAGVWDDNYVMVQHLQEDPGPGGVGDFVDSTQYNNDGTSDGVMTTSDQVAGQIDGSLDFDGVDDTVNGTLTGLPSHVMTASCWIYPHTTGEDTQGRIIMLKPSNGWNAIFFERLQTNRLRVGMSDGVNAIARVGSNNDITLNAWNHVVWSYDGSAGGTGIKIYVNGKEVTYSSTTGTGSVSAALTNFIIGANDAAGGYAYDGIIDNVYLSDIVRSAEYIETEYNNTAYPSLFISLGSEQSVDIYYVNASDSILISDSVSMTKTVASVLYEIYVSDTITIDDSVELDKTVASILYQIFVSDTISITDSVSISKTVASILYEIFISDAYVFTDLINVSHIIASVLYITNKSDTITISDSVGIEKTTASVSYYSNLSDSITIVDSVELDKTTASVNYFVNISDSINITDSISLDKTTASVSYYSNLSDSITITDSISLDKTTALVNYYVNLTDSVTLTDSVNITKTIASVNYYSNLSDSITITDSLNITKTTATVNYYTNVSDSITITDSVDITKTTASVSYYSNLSESIFISDYVSINKTIASISYSVNVSDSITITDSVYLNKTTAGILYLIYIEDTLTWSDNVSLNKTTVVVNYYVNVSETITLSDSVELNKTTASIGYNESISDTITISDSVNMTKTLASIGYNVSLSDTISLSDSVNMTKTISLVEYNVSADDTITISDSVIMTKTPYAYAPTITLYSQSPELVFQGSTGDFDVTWLVNHTDSNLNESSVAFIYTIGHDGTYNSSMRVPWNSRAPDMFRGDGRNDTLWFEDNETITEGNIWKWGGADENSARLSIIGINATHSYVRWEGTLRDTVFPSMHFIDRTEMQSSDKTTVNIYRNHGLLTKLWSPEVIVHPGGEFISKGYIDGFLSGLSPTRPLMVTYLNDSYDPEGAVDPLDSLYGVTITSHNASTWTDTIYSPYTSNYNRGWVVNSTAITDADIVLTEEYYIYLSSTTPSALSYSVYVTNDDTSTNVSFANTNVLWVEGSQVAYTPNIFTSERHGGLEFEMKLFAGNTADLNSVSPLETFEIWYSEFLPTKPVISHFNYSNSNDYDMDGVYSGVFGIVIDKSTDPDGGVVSYNVTLHYADNGTFVTVINDTVDSDDGINGLINLTFNSTPFYSSEKYVIKYCAEDDETDTVCTLSSVGFNLAETVRLSGYVYYSITANDTIYLPNATVTVDSGNSSVTNIYGFYNLGKTIAPGSTEILSERYGFEDNSSEIFIIADTEYNITMEMDVDEHGIREARAKRLPLGGVLPLLAIIIASMCLGLTSKMRNK